MNNSILIRDDSEILLELFGKINIYSVLILSGVGLIGNSLLAYVYASKKRCINSSHVYLLYSSINDNLFLIIHLFEDTLKIYLEIYSIEKDHFLQMFNLADMNNIQCIVINYLRNALRFISAYLVVVYTLQRFFIVYKPLTAKFKDTKSAWLIISIISLIGILLNIWVPFIFKLNDDQSCDINQNYTKDYFYINLSYIVVVLVIPMILVFTCNLLILMKIKKNKIERKKLQEINERKESKIITKHIIPRSSGSQNLSVILNTRLSKISSYSINIDELVLKSFQKVNKSSNKTTIQLCLVSLSFSILYLPYLIGWLTLYYNFSLDQLNSTYKNKISSFLQIAKIFYIFYYGVKFYILYLTSSEFRNIFSKTGKFNFLSNYFFINNNYFFISIYIYEKKINMKFN